MRATNLYVFKAGDRYALTDDETGSNLPKSSSGEWLRFGDTTTIDLAEVLPHALDDISERGFCLLKHSPTKPPLCTERMPPDTSLDLATALIRFDKCQPLHDDNSAALFAL